MKLSSYVEGVSRAFWRRIEPFKNQFERELPSDLPVEFKSFMGTALSLIGDDVLVWNAAPNEPDDNACCLIQMPDTNYAIGYYNDVQKVFALTTCDYAHISSADRWAQLSG